MRVMRGMHGNWMSWPNAKVEVVETSDRSVTARFSRPYASHFGDDGMLYDCSIKEFERVMELVQQEIADYLDLRHERHQDDDWITVTLTKKATDSE